MRHSLLVAAILLLAASHSAPQLKADASQDQIPSNFAPSGKEMFKQYCAACHGSSEMPTWGGIFQHMDSCNQAAVQKRIKNLCDYLASVREK
jgi:mono/diheme cytochrome c family protein